MCLTRLRSRTDRWFIITWRILFHLSHDNTSHCITYVYCPPRLFSDSLTPLDFYKVFNCREFGLKGKGLQRCQEGSKREFNFLRIAILKVPISPKVVTKQGNGICSLLHKVIKPRLLGKAGMGKIVVAYPCPSHKTMPLTSMPLFYIVTSILTLILNLNQTLTLPFHQLALFSRLHHYPFPSIS